MALVYSQADLPDEKSSCNLGYAVLTNGRAILLDYNIDSWDISHNVFYHYGILIDDEMPLLQSNPFGPSLFKDNRIIPPDGVKSNTFKNGGQQFD